MLRTFLLLFITGTFLASATLVSDGVNVGDKATDFSLKGVSGKMVSLSDYKDAKGYILIFTCNSCPYAKAYEQRIIALHEKYAPKGYPVVAINPNDPKVKPDDSFKEMQKISKEHKYPFAYLFDEKQEVAKAYGATRTPHVYLLDKGLKVHYIGAIDDNYKDADAANKKYVEDAIVAMMKGEPVKESFTKAIGCTIKWRDDS